MTTKSHQYYSLKPKTVTCRLCSIYYKKDHNMFSKFKDKYEIEESHKHMNYMYLRFTLKTKYDLVELRQRGRRMILRLQLLKENKRVFLQKGKE